MSFCSSWSSKCWILCVCVFCSCLPEKKYKKKEKEKPKIFTHFANLIGSGKKQLNCLLHRYLPRILTQLVGYNGSCQFVDWTSTTLAMIWGRGGGGKRKALHAWCSRKTTFTFGMKSVYSHDGLFHKVASSYSIKFHAILAFFGGVCISR